MVESMPAQLASRIRAWLRGWGRSVRSDAGRAPGEAGADIDLTERTRIERTLAAHRQLLEIMVNQMPTAVCLIRGSDLRLHLVNPAYQAIAPGKAMLGRTLDEIWPETGQDFAAICGRVLETGEPHQVVDELNMIRRRPDGPLEPAYFSWSVHRVQLPGGEGWGLVNAAWETTARRQVENQVKRLAEQRRLALDAAKLGWWEYNPTTRIAEWDDGYKAIFGVAGYSQPNDEILQQIIHPEDLSGLWAKVEAALNPADPRPFSAQYRINRPDGQMRWVQAYGIARFEGEGGARRAVAFIGTVEDITDRKKADEALRLRTEELAALLDALPAYVWFGDAECRLITGNRAANELIGVAPGSNVSQSVVANGQVPSLCQLKPDGTEYRADELPMQRAIATRQPVLGTVIDFSFPDGRHVQTVGNAVPLFDIDGEVRGSVAAFMDVTTCAEAEKALRESEARLRQALEAGEVFTFEWDPASDTVLRSPNSGPILGWDSDATRDTGQSFFAAIHPADREAFVSTVTRLTPEHPAYVATYRYVRRGDGREVVLEETGRAVFADTGTMVSVRGLTRDVTERKRAEEALRESAARLRLAQDSAGAGMWDWDFGTGKLEWSEELFRLFGLDPATHEASFESWGAVIHPEDRQLAERRIEAAVANHAPLASEYRVVLPSGEVRWISALGQALYDADGTPLRMSGICIDISGVKQVEDDLRQSENRYRTLFESMAEGFALHEMILDGQGRPVDYRFLEVNPSFARLTGLDPQAIIGRTVRDVIPTVEDSWIETYGRVAETGVSERFERHLTALGRWYEVYAYSPAPGRFAAAFTDITARKETEAALRQSREDLDRAQEVGQIGSWRLDVRRNVLTWSDENFRIFGAPPGAPQTYQTFLEAVHPDDREYVDAKWNAGLRGEPYDIEHRIVADGLVKWVREKAFLEFDDGGTLLGGFGITQDITERKRAEDQLRESLAEKELLLREIHHRVKNNLQVVSSLVNLQADALADPALRGVFREVQSRVQSMALIHEKLYESGGLARLNFADYAASLTQSIWSAHGAGGLGMRLRLDVEPVALSVATAVPCGLILNELVSNALKHAFPSGGGTVTVGLAHETGTGRLCLRVCDDGIGLPAGLDWRRARTLGLRLVQMLARQLDGSVDTGPGPGTEFRISFDAKEADGASAPTDAAGSAGSRSCR